MHHDSLDQVDPVVDGRPMQQEATFGIGLVDVEPLGGEKVTNSIYPAVLRRHHHVHLVRRRHDVSRGSWGCFAGARRVTLTDLAASIFTVSILTIWARAVCVTGTVRRHRLRFGFSHGLSISSLVNVF